MFLNDEHEIVQNGKKLHLFNHILTHTIRNNSQVSVPIVMYNEIDSLKKDRIFSIGMLDFLAFRGVCSSV